MSFFSYATPLQARRAFLGSGLALSGAAVALLAGNSALAKSAGPSKASDVGILNSALASELEAIAAYQVGAGSGLLQKPVLALVRRDIVISLLRNANSELADGLRLARHLVADGERQLAPVRCYRFHDQIVVP